MDAKNAPAEATPLTGYSTMYKIKLINNSPITRYHSPSPIARRLTFCLLNFVVSAHT